MIILRCNCGTTLELGEDSPILTSRSSLKAMPDWRPADDIPKDTWILVCKANDPKIMICKYDAKKQRWIKDDDHETVSPYAEYYNYWMPLPEIPKV